MRAGVVNHIERQNRLWNPRVTLTEREREFVRQWFRVECMGLKPNVSMVGRLMGIAPATAAQHMGAAVGLGMLERDGRAARLTDAGRRAAGV